MMGRASKTAVLKALWIIHGLLATDCFHWNHTRHINWVSSSVDAHAYMQ